MRGIPADKRDCTECAPVCERAGRQRGRIGRVGGVQWNCEWVRLAKAFIARLVVEVAVAQLRGFHGGPGVDGAPPEAGKLHGNAHRVPLHRALHALVRILRLDRTDHGVAHGCRVFRTWWVPAIVYQKRHSF